MILNILLSTLLMGQPSIPQDSLGQPEWGLCLGTQLSILQSSPWKLSPGAHLGFYYTRPLGSAIGIHLALHHKTIPDFGQRVRFSRYLLNPDVGLSSISWEAHARTLRFLEAPILLEWLQRGQCWSVGIRPSINFIVETESFPIYSLRGHNLEDFGQFDPVSAREGMRRWDLGLVVGWSKPLWHRLSLDVRYTQGLFDLTHDNFFKHTTNHTNSDLQVALRVRLGR